MRIENGILELVCTSDIDSDGHLVVPDGVREIEVWAFENFKAVGHDVFLFDSCTNLKSIHLPEGLKELGNWTFQDCTSLQSVHLPDGMEKICGRAFKGCTNLQSINFPDGLEEIWPYAFEDCANLKSVHLPDSIAYLNASAFLGCPCFEEIICRHQEKISDHGFKWVVDEGRLTNRMFEECKDRLVEIYMRDMHKSHLLNKIRRQQMRIKNGVLEWVYPSDMDANGHVIVPDGVREIGHCAFRDCKSLKSVQLPNGLEKIGMYAFAHLASLKSIHLPDGLMKISSEAFVGCPSLERIRIPYSVTCIEPSYFLGCPCFEDVICAHKGRLCDIKFLWLIANGHLTHRIIAECKDRLMRIYMKWKPKTHLLKQIRMAADEN